MEEIGVLLGESSQRNPGLTTLELRALSLLVIEGTDITTENKSRKH